MSKSVIIHGLAMPEPTEDGLKTFVDVRIYSDGEVLLPCAAGECDTLKAEEAE